MSKSVHGCEAHTIAHFRRFENLICINDSKINILQKVRKVYSVCKWNDYLPYSHTLRDIFDLSSIIVMDR